MGELSLQAEGRVSLKHPRGCAPRGPWCFLLTPSSSQAWDLLRKWVSQKGEEGALWGLAKPAPVPGGALWGMQRAAGSALQNHPCCPAMGAGREFFMGCTQATLPRVCCGVMMKAATPGQDFTGKKGCHSNNIRHLSRNLQLFGHCTGAGNKFHLVSLHHSFE